MGMVPLEAVDGATARVLLVEDDFFVRSDVADELRRLGFEVVEAASADDAMEYIEAGDRIDGLVTDVCMPGVLDGLGLAERVRAKYPVIPIIVASGNVTVERAASRLGKFVPKPFQPDRLAKMIADIIGSPL